MLLALNGLIVPEGASSADILVVDEWVALKNHSRLDLPFRGGFEDSRYWALAAE